MIRRAALASVLLVVLSTASVSAGGGPVVQMLTSSFSPSVLQVTVGNSVIWDNGSGTLHTTTANKFDAWDRNVSNGSETQVTFTRAGTWAYHCQIHSGMTGKIKARPTASPSSGTTSTTFTIRVATVNAASGFAYDIQRRKGANSFKTWHAITGQTKSWTPGSAGTWQFRARYRQTSTGAATGWSQPVTVTVS